MNKYTFTKIYTYTYTYMYIYMHVYDPEPELEPEPEPEPGPYSNKMSEPEPEPSSIFPVPQPCRKVCLKFYLFGLLLEIPYHFLELPQNNTSIKVGKNQILKKTPEKQNIPYFTEFRTIFQVQVII